jgi:hypothetical protein
VIEQQLALPSGSLYHLLGAISPYSVGRGGGGMNSNPGLGLQVFGIVCCCLLVLGSLVLVFYFD